MTQIPDKIEPMHGWGGTITSPVTSHHFNHLIEYLTAREKSQLENDDKLYKKIVENAGEIHTVYKELTSRVDTIAGNQLEMKRGEKPEPYLPQMCWCGEVDCMGAEVEVGGKVHRPDHPCYELTASEQPQDQPKRWRAEIENDYWYVEDCGEISKDYESDYSVEDFRYAIGNYHPTREAAEAYKAKLLADNQQ